MLRHRVSRKLTFALLFTGFLVAGLACTDARLEVASGTAFVDVSVVDVLNGQIIEGQTVILQVDQIFAVEPSERVVLGDEVFTIQGSGKYLIPGLWDMHAHAIDRDGKDLFPELFVANGVTGIREMWGDLEIAEDIRSEAGEGRRVIPRLVVAGNLIEGKDPFWPGSNVASTPEAGRALVDSLVAAGAGFIKVYHTLEPEVFFAIADQASKIGIPFVGHVPIGVTVSQAADVGMSSIEHAITLFYDCAIEKDAPSLQAYQGGWDEGECAAVAEQLRRNGTWYVPSLVTERGYAFLDTQEFQSDPRLRFMPDFIRSWWLPENDLFGSEYTAEDWLTAKEGYSHVVDVTRFLADQGVQILAGSDTPNAYAFPGFGLHDELEILVKAGLTPLQALRAATIDAARFLEATDTLGSVEPGKVADLVLLGGNPLEDISNTREILAVVLNGRLLDRDDLDGLLAWAEEKAKELKES